LFHGHVVFKRNAGLCLCGHVLRPGAVAVRGRADCHAFAHQPFAVESGIGFHDRAAAFKTGNDRERFLHAILIAQKNQIGRVDGGRCHFDQHLASA